ncbi:hypothetical protein JYT31_02370 [Beggiatoa alba]|nr:hypothetical protein [Beggiatoa alba]
MKRERSKMSDSINEKLSSLIDDEQKLDDVLMDALANDSDAKDKWARYNLVSDILNAREQQTLDKAWVAELSEKLEKEPSILAPRMTRSFRRKIVKQMAGFAVAASVATLAILTLQQNKFSDISAPASIAKAPTTVPTTAPQIRTVTLRLNKATESKLNGYIVNHYEHSMTGKMQGLMPYMRIVSVTAAERIVHEK